MENYIEDDDPIRFSNWWTGYVYLIKCNEFYKIGYSKRNPAYRLSNLQTGNPYPLTLVLSHFCENACRAESEVHKIVEKKRVRGEWFSLSKEDIVKITEKLLAYE